MNKSGSKIILEIETSCDETAASVLSFNHDGKWPQIKTLSSVVKSQIKLHAKMGGVVPEAAARAHVKNIRPVVEKTINDSQLTITHIDYITVTVGPGLIPSLMVGTEFAKALSLATKKPIIPVNHMLGHLYSPFHKSSSPSGRGVRGEGLFPMISLIVSGGHTMLVLMKDVKHYQVLGQTVDDAAGEAFDKVAKLLRLPYPGGPEVSNLATKGKPDFVLPRPMINNKNYDFSFSGLKTAVLYRLRDFPKTKPADVCKAFEDEVLEVLVTKTMRAAKQYQARSISLSGGVAANQVLRHELNLKSKILSLKFFVPPQKLCTDNAEM